MDSPIRIDDAGHTSSTEPPRLGALAASAYRRCARPGRVPDREHRLSRHVGGHSNEIWRDANGAGNDRPDCQRRRPRGVLAVRSRISTPRAIRSSWCFAVPTAGCAPSTGCSAPSATTISPAPSMRRRDRRPGGLVLDARRVSPRRLSQQRRASARVLVAGPGRGRPWRPDGDKHRGPVGRRSVAVLRHDPRRPTSSPSGAPTAISEVSTGDRTAPSARTTSPGFAGTRRPATIRSPGSPPAEDIASHRLPRRQRPLYELAWPNVAPVGGRDLTALSGAPAASWQRVRAATTRPTTRSTLSSARPMAGCTSSGTFSARRRCIMPT